MIKVAIIGASGYAGAELIRILRRHPGVQLVGLASRTHAGQPLSAAWPHLPDATPFTPPDAALTEADTVFLATPNGYAMQIVPDLLERGQRVIDLSADYRLPPPVFEAWYGLPHKSPEHYPNATYGLVELHRHELPEARLVANPGCYVTAATLALAPLAAVGLAHNLIVNAASGVSGAGRDAAGTSFAEINEDYKPYKPAGTHRHTPEIELNLARVQAQGRHVRTHGERQDLTLTFVPHLVPMTRGILVTAYATPPTPPTEAELYELYRTFYAHESFVRVTEALPRTKGTWGANTVWIALRLDARTGRIVVFAALDNLVKGAAGQAVQNFNRMHGFDETTALDTAGVWP